MIIHNKTKISNEKYQNRIKILEKENLENNVQII